MFLLGNARQQVSPSEDQIAHYRIMKEDRSC
jgi:hypothetical protein